MNWITTALSFLGGSKLITGALVAALAGMAAMGWALKNAYADKGAAEASLEAVASQNRALAAGLDQLHAAKQKQAEAFASNRRALLDIQASHSKLAQEIRHAPDPSGCADTPLPADISRLLAD